jgi:hypothetical protein
MKTFFLFLCGFPTTTAILLVLGMPSSVSSLSSPSPTKSSSTTIVVGLNAALQKRFILPNDASILIPGNVHRAKEVQIGVGGKGQDVAISLNCLNYLPAGLQLAQFVGHGELQHTISLCGFCCVF